MYSCSSREAVEGWSSFPIVQLVVGWVSSCVEASLVCSGKPLREGVWLLHQARPVSLTKELMII